VASPTVPGGGGSSVGETKRVWTDTRAFDRSYSDGLNRGGGGRGGGGGGGGEEEEGGAVPAQHWFWYLGFGGGRRVGRGGGLLSCGGGAVEEVSVGSSP